VSLEAIRAIAKLIPVIRVPFTVPQWHITAFDIDGILPALDVSVQAVRTFVSVVSP
jgi:hypothetical protein